MIYETNANREAQAAALRDFIGVAGVTFHLMLPTVSVADCIVRTGRLALIEIKVRSNQFQKYPTLIIDKRKLDDVSNVANMLGMSSGLLVRWTDAFGLLRLESIMDKSYPTIMGGRTDRDDPNDIDKVYEIPTGDFKIWGMPRND
tara:strand:+ start:477 stop:911 length:435 start_codon:yes stop_codon:yes gene_type:complete